MNFEGRKVRLCFFWLQSWTKCCFLLHWFLCAIPSHCIFLHDHLANFHSVDGVSLQYQVCENEKFHLKKVHFVPLCCFIERISLCHKNLFFSDNSAFKNSLEGRDLKLTRAILTNCLAYIFCVGPMSILVLFDPHFVILGPNFELGFHILYWSQYSINFIIYAARR